MRKTVLAMVAVAVSGAVVAQVGPGPNQGMGRGGGMAPGLGGGGVMRPVPLPAAFGTPLPGLDAGDLAAFAGGRAAFVQVETPPTGLGPLFNGRSCVECHGVPAAGGASGIEVTRFGRIVGGAFDPMEGSGGSLLQRLSVPPGRGEAVPAEATIVVRRQSTSLFGLGLVEAIPDEAIQAQAAAAKPDGVRGRVAIVHDVATGAMRVGRFGWKAQHATLLSFTAEAYRDELGITNRFFPAENQPNGLPAATGPIEDAVDPATGLSDADRATAFMRFLASPPRATVSASAQAGDALFAQVGCTACHVPVMVTGRSPVAALSEKAVALYSDLLLHDMGALNDGVAQASAAMNEMKTPPLWGLRVTAPYLHDGRAPTIDAAIRAHDGEARIARDRYVGLTPAQRQQVLDFLGTL